MVKYVAYNQQKKERYAFNLEAHPCRFARVVAVRSSSIQLRLTGTVFGMLCSANSGTLFSKQNDRVDVFNG